MVYVERLFSLFILLAVAIFFFVSFQYKMITLSSGMGAGFFPRIISLILLILISIHVFSVFRNKSTSNNDEDSSTNETFKKQVLMLVVILVSLFLIDKIGMLTTLGLFLLTTLHYFEKISWIKSIMFSVVTIAVFYFVFVRWLNIALPSGMLL